MRVAGMRSALGKASFGSSSRRVGSNTGVNTAGRARVPTHLGLCAIGGCLRARIRGPTSCERSTIAASTTLCGGYVRCECRTLVRTRERRTASGEHDPLHACGWRRSVACTRSSSQVFVHRYGGGPAICREELDIYAAPAATPPGLSVSH